MRAAKSGGEPSKVANACRGVSVALDTDHFYVSTDGGEIRRISR